MSERFPGPEDTFQTSIFEESPTRAPEKPAHTSLSSASLGIHAETMKTDAYRQFRACCSLVGKRHFAASASTIHLWFRTGFLKGWSCNDVVKEAWDKVLEADLEYRPKIHWKDYK